MFINKNQMMAIIKHYLKHTFNLNCAKALKLSQGKKDSKGIVRNKKEAHRRQ
jgi:hypothetical protein